MNLFQDLFSNSFTLSWSLEGKGEKKKMHVKRKGYHNALQKLSNNTINVRNALYNS